MISLYKLEKLFPVLLVNVSLTSFSLKDATHEAFNRMQFGKWTLLTSHPLGSNNTSMFLYTHSHMIHAPATGVKR